MRTRRNVLILLTAAVASAACGGSSSGSTSISGSSGDKGATAPVTMVMNLASFSPATLSGTPGSTQKIHLTNSTAKPHTFTIADQNIDTVVATGAAGDVTVTFPASGELVFVCKYHAKFGMTGKLVAS
jgi:plastocyanin